MTNATNQHHQPAAEIPLGNHFSQQNGGNERWIPRTREELLAALASETPPAFRTALGVTEWAVTTGADGKEVRTPARLHGAFYADFDGDLAETIPAFRRFLHKIEDHGVDLSMCRLYLTGGRGAHVEVPMQCFIPTPSPQGHPDLHAVYKEMMHGLYVDTADLRVYSVKRQWRTPNVQRDNNQFKVAITPAEAMDLTPESYAELCSAPRPHPALMPPCFSPKLGTLFATSRDKVFSAKARRKHTSKAAETFKKMTGGEVPPTIDNLMAGRARLKDGAGWNAISLQIAIVAHSLDISEEALVDRCRGLIAAHQGDGARYRSASQRERELRNQFAYVSDNPLYEVSVPAVLALLDEPADDLRDMIADVADNGFSVLDLMTGSGKSRRLRKDIEALLQLLVRDPRLDGLAYFDEFGQSLRAGKPWQGAMQMDCAPNDEGDLNDDHARALMHWFAREWKLTIGFDTAFRLMVSWAQCDRRNTVKDRLEAYTRDWDGEARLDSWLIDYAHACTQDEGEDFEPFVRAAGTKWVISAVARVFSPGCQADVALILTGPQGHRKSTVLRVLGEALGKDAYADGFSLEGDHKAALERLRGRAVVEWAEMTGLTKRDVREVKNFVSQRDDAFRAPYERVVRKWPRTTVIAGTSNEAELFADSTGNRRFWVVEVGKRIEKAELERLKELAPQIWGEACHRFKNGESWWIDPTDEAELHALAQARQTAAQVSSRYDDLAVEAARLIVEKDRLVTKVTDWVGPEAWYTVREMQTILIELNRDRHFDDQEWRQMVTAMKRQGWEAKQKTKARVIHYHIGRELRQRMIGATQARNAS